MPWFALILAVMSEIIIDRIMIATGGRDENLKIEVHDQEILLKNGIRKSVLKTPDLDRCPF